MSEQYVVIWIKVDDEADAEKVEELALDALERIGFGTPRGRVVQNRIQDVQP